MRLVQKDINKDKTASTCRAKLKMACLCVVFIKMSLRASRSVMNVKMFLDCKQVII